MAKSFFASWKDSDKLVQIKNNGYSIKYYRDLDSKYHFLTNQNIKSIIKNNNLRFQSILEDDFIRIIGDKFVQCKDIRLRNPGMNIPYQSDLE